MSEIEIEYDGVRAILRGYFPYDSWSCPHPGVKAELDLLLDECIEKRLCPYPSLFGNPNWPIEAGRIIARLVGAKIVREQPWTPPDPPYVLPPDAEN